MKIQDIFSAKNARYVIDHVDNRRLEAIAQERINETLKGFPNAIVWAFYKDECYNKVIDGVTLNPDGTLKIVRRYKKEFNVLFFLPLETNIIVNLQKVNLENYLTRLDCVYLQLCGNKSKEGLLAIGLESTENGTEIGHYIS